MTKKAFENAITIVMVLGGSTNAGMLDVTKRNVVVVIIRIIHDYEYTVNDSLLLMYYMVVYLSYIIAYLFVVYLVVLLI